MGRQPAVGGTPATVALDRAGIGYSVHSYVHDPAVASFGLEAAAALGVEVERVFKTLLVDTGRALAVGVVPVHLTLDLKSLASVLGHKKVDMATAADAQRATGYVVGGISPIGQKRLLPIVIDASVSAYPTIFVSGGRRGLDIEIAPADLVQVTGARLAQIARRR